MQRGKRQAYGGAPRSADALAFAQMIADRLVRAIEPLKAQWQQPQGTPTRHFVVDDLLPQHEAERVWQAFPQTEPIWYQYETFRERKKTFAKLDAINPLISAITDAFHENNVLDAVQRITDLEDLEADPELYAGGISMMSRGDFLNPHIDNSHDGPRRRYRRLNLLYYISHDWRREFGGNFELWDEKVTKPKEIQSSFNRLVVMETNRTSWHSVNPVVADKNRCCISNYYFSTASPENRHYYHVTSFTGRPGELAARAFGKIDNAFRQWVAVVTKRSRGKSLTRYG